MVVDRGRFDDEVQPALPEAVRSSSYQHAQSARIVTVRVINARMSAGGWVGVQDSTAYEDTSEGLSDATTERGGVSRIEKAQIAAG